ncbi:3-beta-hydroxysteroid-Delta(8) Delta(7)-isomerase [Biomphalaria pfeifferi]|uniref:3-beta-hydroxysteroid-Delta(8) Delta(7)-isomerase n=1 Tax=Biomphalaria pfeifferi TaxID=112525 RepID=A0AAD8AZA0_BIOPF|nr:3-beta-hydroxysteroid-Delta(8) Delta(7)-isomerase [Biomphalaria pfeifferi]
MASEQPKSVVKHPYLPKDLKLPLYISNVKSTTEILAILAVAAGVLVIFAWYLSGLKLRQQKFCFKRRMVLCWFFLCAFIHMVLEGYFAIYHATLAGHTSILGEMWKEYSKCDSRYISSDTFTVCMETITAAIDGPLALITFLAFIYGSNYRYGFQLMLSLFQLYGDVLYFSTEWKDGFVHGHTDDPLFFYFYFLFLNSLWIIIPTILVIDALRHIASCQKVSDFYIDTYNRKMAKRNVSYYTNHHDKSK